MVLALNIHSSCADKLHDPMCGNKEADNGMRWYRLRVGEWHRW